MKESITDMILSENEDKNKAIEKASRLIAQSIKNDINDLNIIENLISDTFHKLNGIQLPCRYNERNRDLKDSYTSPTPTILYHLLKDIKEGKIILPKE